MKRFLLTTLIGLLLYNGSSGQALYINNTSAGFSFNPGLNSLGNPKVLLDDVLIPSVQVGGSDSIAITKVKVAISRAANAPATTVRFYYTPVDDTSSSFNDVIKIPPVLFATVNLAANGATPVSGIIPLGDSISPLFKIKTDTGSLYTGFQTFFIGLSFSTNGNGWILATPTQSPNDDVFWFYDADSTVKRAYSYFNGATAPSATFYLEAYGRGLGGTFPVSLMNFDGRLNNDEVILNWSTASENNNKGFEIEKSSNGTNFSKIGFVAGNDNSSSLKNYSYTDSKLAPGANYYRLKQVDKDNKVIYSKTVVVKWDKASWSVYPNPTIDYVNISINLLSKTRVYAQLIGVDGKIYQTIDKGVLDAGSHRLLLKPAAKGTYRVKLVIGENVYNKTVNKL